MADDRTQLRLKADIDRKLWLTAAELDDLMPVRAHAFLTDDGALHETLSRLVRLGLATISGADAAAGALEAVVARFGFIRETNYGRLFDVRAEPAPTHPAYTSRALDLHTDNPYRDPAPTVQLLHAIQIGTAGGDTRFVDGFAQALAMADEDPDGFDALAAHPVDFRHADHDGAVYEARRTVIALDADGWLEAIHFNARALVSPSPAPDWQTAYQAFSARLHRPDTGLVVRWRPGDIVVFDNRRILHGRDAFAAPSRAGARWLQGCYADMDGVRATLARLSTRAAP